MTHLSVRDLHCSRKPNYRMVTTADQLLALEDRNHHGAGCVMGWSVTDAQPFDVRFPCASVLD
jgi:hypothetical protein